MFVVGSTEPLIYPPNHNPFFSDIDDVRYCVQKVGSAVPIEQEFKNPIRSPSSPFYILFPANKVNDPVAEPEGQSLVNIPVHQPPS